MFLEPFGLVFPLPAFPGDGVILLGIAIKLPSQFTNESLGPGMGGTSLIKVHQFPKFLGVVDDHARSQGVLTEGLPSPNPLEER